MTRNFMKLLEGSPKFFVDRVGLSDGFDGLKVGQKTGSELGDGCDGRDGRSHLGTRLVEVRLVADATDPQALNAEALALFNQGLKELKAGREREGAELARLINERLTSIEEDVLILRELVPQMLATQRQKVLDRFADMKADLDPTRLEQEMVLLAQKSDVAEELDRLSTHILEVRRVLKSSGAAGRRLDFLMQELNREANTLGSKAFDPRSTQAAVNLKVLIEQMREQVQNIE